MRSREGTNVKIVSIRVIVGLDVFKWPCRVFYCVNEVTTTEVPMQSLTPANPVSIVDVDHGADKVTSSLPFFPEDVHSFPSVFLHRCRLNNFLDTLLTVWVLICYWLKKKLLDVYLKYCVPRQSAESCKLQNHGPSASSASVWLSACTRKWVDDSIAQVYLRRKIKMQTNF